MDCSSNCAEETDEDSSVATPKLAVIDLSGQAIS